MKALVLSIFLRLAQYAILLQKFSESEVSGTRTLHCTNTHCPAKQLKKFGRFVSKEGVNIDGLSEQTVQKFINLGWVREYADLFHITEHATELRTMEGFGIRVSLSYWLLLKKLVM